MQSYNLRIRMVLIKTYKEQATAKTVRVLLDAYCINSKFHALIYLLKCGSALAFRLKKTKTKLNSLTQHKSYWF